MAACVLRQPNPMPLYLTKTLFLIFTISTVLTCGAAFTVAATEKTVASENNTRSAVPAKPSRPFYTFLADTAVRASQKPFLQYPGEQSSNNKETADSAASPTGTLFPAQETRPMRSLMIGWQPAKNDTTTTGRYQPGSYQYASTGTEAECRTVDKASNAEEIPDDGNKGLRLPAGWLLGMCLHY